MTPEVQPKLWHLVLDRPQIDADELAAALEDQVLDWPLDYRTRLLVRRGLESLRDIRGAANYERWLYRSPGLPQFETILAEMFDEVGFPSLRKRVTMTTKPETVEQYLRELGQLVAQPTRLVIGGAIAGILAGYLQRRTEDIDLPDEVPEAIRGLRGQLDQLAQRYGLRLTHFQSHYLPEGWQDRLHSLGTFGRLTVLLVDPYDLFVGKLFSRREKDRDDLRVLAQALDKPKTIAHLAHALNLFADPNLKQAAQENWYILYGEPLPEASA
ncbi:MAG: hypothetical protein HY000_30760 [Planctomycetes bacterium]|nr:hypothetical protein [Planctomycetota bacterium]